MLNQILIKVCSCFKLFIFFSSEDNSNNDDCSYSSLCNNGNSYNN